MRATVKAILGALLILLVISGAVLFSLRLATVRAQIAARLGQVLSDDQRTVTISTLGGSLPFAPTVALLEIADRRGTWLRIENLSVDIDPRPLLLSHIHVQAASADRVVVWRLPEPDDDPFVLKPHRLLVTAKRIEARAIELGSVLLGGEEAGALATPIVAEARGWVDLARLTLSVEGSASTSCLDDLLRGADRELSVTTSTARVDVKAHGAIMTPSGRGALLVNDVRRGALSVGAVEIEAEAERLGVGDRRYRVTLAARTSELDGPADLVAWLGRAPELRAVARFAATPRVFDVDALKLETATFDAELAGSGGEEGGVEIRQLSVNVPDLRAVPLLSSAVRAGAARVRGSASIARAWTEPEVDARVSVEMMQLEAADAHVAGLLGAKPRLGATLHYDRDQGLEAGSVYLEGDSLEADADATLTPDRHVKIRAEVTIPDLSVLPRATLPLTGALQSVLAFDGTVDGFDATATVRPRSVRIGRTEPLEGDVTIRARRDRGTIAGDAAARLTIGAHPTSAEGRYTYDIERRTLGVPALSLSLPGMDAQASGEVQPTPMLFRGQAVVRGRDLARAGALFGIDVAGQSELTLGLDHSDGQPLVRGKLVGRDLRYEELSLESLGAEVMPVERGRASRFQVNAHGHYRHEFAVTAGGTASGTPARADISFERLEGSYGEHPFAVHRPLRIALGEGEIALQDGALELAGGSIEGRWGPGGLRGVGRLRFAHLPLALLSLATEAPAIAGQVTGELSRSNPNGPLEFHARTLGAGIASGAAPGGVAQFELDATASVSTRRSRIESSLATPDDALRAELTADLPAGIDGVERAGALSGRLAGTLGAELIGQLFVPDEDRIDGRLDVALVFGGTLQSPTADGRATGRLGYLSAVSGMELRIDQIDLQADGHRLRVAAFKGSDGRAGVIEGRGDVDFGGGFGDAVYDVEVAFLDTYIARIDEVRLRGDGVVRLTGRGTNARLTGGFTADEALVRIPDRLPPDIATIPIEHVNVELSRNPPAPDEDDAPFLPLGLDFALQFPGHLRLEDPNLDSEWRGDLFVRGDTAAPKVQGRLSVLRGSFGLGGVQFRAREGFFSFEEGSEVPLVDVTAVAYRNDVEATLRLHGRVDRLEVDLRSEPPLPQDEILSRLMFGTTATTLTPGQSIQLAQAVARLSGQGPGLDVLGRVRRYVGVDRIEIKDTTDTATGTTTTAVSVGKYLSDRVYVSFDQAVRGEGSKARVEVELTRQIAAETEVGQDQNALVGLKWRWNY